MASKEVNCGPCKREGNISDPVLFCTKCEEYICDACTEIHKQFDSEGHTCVLFDNSTETKICNSINSVKANDNNIDGGTIHGNDTFSEVKNEKYTVDLDGDSNLNDTIRQVNNDFIGEVSNMNDTIDLVNHEKNTIDEISNSSETIGEENTIDENSSWSETIGEVKKETIYETCNTKHTVEFNNFNETTGEFCNTNKNASSETLCDLCNYRNEQNAASRFCEECQENLCDQCIDIHKRRKATSQHHFVSIAYIQGPDNFSDITCDPCTYRCKSSPAKWHCQMCEENLCQICHTEHDRSKATESHKTIPIKDLQKLDQKDCDICKMSEKTNTAILICSICEENLCASCGDHHRLRKATKNHTLSEIKSLPPKNEDCDICQIRGENQVALVFCGDCEEKLCSACADQHKLRKATRNHVLTNISMTKSSKGENGVPCDPCQKSDKTLTASSFCPVCLEFLCVSCTCQHSRMDTTADHSVIGMDEFKHNSKAMQTSYCDPCKSVSQIETALFYCEACDELLCRFCSKQHKTFKATKDHSQLGVAQMFLRQFLNQTLCDVCAEQNNQVHATVVCSICEERLCEACSSQHSVQKATRGHKLVAVDEKQSFNLSGTGSKDDVKDEDQTKPGKPVQDDIATNSIRIRWKQPNKPLEEITHYDIRFREVGVLKWRVHSTDKAKEIETMSDLKCDTPYQLKVRAVFGDEEGSDSPVSETIRTKISLARKVVELSVKRNEKLEDGQPAVYKIPIKENTSFRNDHAKTRKCFFGEPVCGVLEKTIMVIGATGAGKTTMIDGMINYILDVSWEDDFRFTMIDLMEDEKQKNKDQTVSQTEWITCYTIHLTHGSQIYYTLNIIDTPGFGDTRGIDRDHKIVEQIHELFTLPGEQGVSTIDGVCFVTQSPLARLTTLQRYIIDSILSIFGRDIIRNIFALVTFADGKTPPVLEALKSADVPIVESFIFNNSALFASNRDLPECSFAPMFWKMGKDSFKTFFKHLNDVQPRSLQLTSEVLQERKQLETLVQGLRPQIDEGLSKIETLRQEDEILQRHWYDIEHNREFTYEVDKTCQRKIDLDPGVHVTNCLTCNRTCHDRCKIADDADKMKCSSMSNGYCKVCPQHCIWNIHKNNPYKFELYVEKVQGTYEELKARYETAQSGALKQKGVIIAVRNEVRYLSINVGKMINNMRLSINRLSEIALKPNPLSNVQYIDLLIETEIQEKKAGYLARVGVMRSYRKNAELLQNLPSGNYKPFGDIDLDNFGQKKKKRMPQKGFKDKFLDFFK